MGITASRYGSVVVVLTLLSSCGRGGSPIDAPGAPDQVLVEIEPPTAQVPPGASTNFRASISGVASAVAAGVDWSVAEGPVGGTIDALGTYTAPSATGTYTVVATSRVDVTIRTTATVLVAVTAPPAAAPDISPASSISTGPVDAAISCPTPGTTPHITTDGSTPTPSSTQSTTARFSASGTLKSICAGSGFATSPVSTATYTISAGAADLASCALDPLRSTGTTVYICDCQTGASAGCVAGNDANVGTSPNSPKQTLAAAAFAFQSMRAGDTVAFCKGGRWAASGTPSWTNTRCNALNTCDVRAYDPPWVGNGARPYFTMNSGAGFASWSSGSTAYSGFRFQGLEIHGTGATGTAFFMYAPVNDVLFCDLLVTDFDIGFQVEDLNRDAIGNKTTRTNVHLVSSTVRGNFEHGWLGGAAGSQIVSNTFAENGTTLRDHNIYIDSHAGVADGIVVTGNHLSRAGGYGGTPCDSTELVAHAVIANLLIEGNTIEETPTEAHPGCWGIELDDQGDASLNDRFDAPIVRGNFIRYVGNESITIGSAHNATIENNVVVASMPGSGIVCGERPSFDTVPYNIAGIRVRNNTVYFTSNSGQGIRFGAAGDGGHEIYNNAVYLAAGGTCEVTNGVVFDAFNACTTAADPTWFASAPSDFTPAGPLVNAGTTRNGQAPMVDVTGKPRDSQPDIGAYER